jgi:hypothetical protein
MESRLRPFFIIERPTQVHKNGLLRCIADLTVFSRFIKSDLKDALDSKTAPNTVWRDGPYLTPNLNFVRNWLRVDLLVENLPTSKFQAVAFELSRALHNSFLRSERWPANPLKSLLLVTEEHSSTLIGDALEQRFNFRPLKGIGRTEQNDLLLEDVSTAIPVVIYADLVSTGESLRRTAQMVLRRGFSVAAVVALLDTRRSPSPHIVAFGQSIPLITLLHYPNEVKSPSKFSVVAPSLLELEDRFATEADLSTAIWPARRQDAVAWDALEFWHRVRRNGRHLTLTLNVKNLMSSKELQKDVASTVCAFLSSSPEDGATNRPLLVLAPSDLRDHDWQISVQRLFAQSEIQCPVTVHFVARTTIGGKASFQGLEAAEGLIRSAVGVVIFDWGVISGRSVDGLTNAAAQLGANRILVLSANSQLSEPELRFRQSVTTLEVSRVIRRAKDLFDRDDIAEERIAYRFVALSTLPLGFYAGQQDCPVCTQVTDLLSIPCGDSFINDYRHKSLRRLQEGEQYSPTDVETDAHALANSVSALRAKLVAAESKTVPRYLIQKDLEYLAAEIRRNSAIDHKHLAVIELLYVEGNWIQAAPIRFKSCREPIRVICSAVIDKGSSEARAKAISIFRRVSKTEFIKSALPIFQKLGGHLRPQGALLFGIHTYLASRYHESTIMIQPARIALEDIQNLLFIDNTKEKPEFLEAVESVKYLLFQAEFLGSRAESKKLDRVQALKGIREVLSEPNYYAHSPQNESAELLLQQQFLDAMRDFLRNASRSTEGKRGIGGSRITQTKISGLRDA